jgi:tRNA modification GTPase
VFVKDADQETICAVSTPSGVGGISVVRLSGSASFQISKSLCSFLPANPESHKAYFGKIKTLESKEEIDEVLLTYFKKGSSFTGEEVCEISCHGSPAIVREILAELVLAGARPANRGEFTYRAFMNGRLDLVQAESVLALIESQSKQSAQQALRQLQGSVSSELAKIEDRLIWCLAHIEASIDFSEENIEVVDNQVLLGKTEELIQRLTTLVSSFRAGRILRDGFQLVLTGIPNVGKSSLMNLLLEKDRAIVTDLPGTTRDLIEEAFLVSGYKVNLVDTAGLRKTDDRIEKIGIEMSYQAQKEADGIFFIFDSSKELSAEEIETLNSLSAEKTLLIGNKRDQVKSGVLDKIEEQILGTPFYKNLKSLGLDLKDKILLVSALEKQDRNSLTRGIEGLIGAGSFRDGAVISQTRHFEKLSQALENMRSANALIADKTSVELQAIELKEALLRVQETLGKRFDDQVMDRVFQEFCIGK